MARHVKPDGAMRSVAIAACLVVVSACRPPGYGKGDDDHVDAAAPAGDAAIDAPDAADPLCERAFRIEGHGSDTSVWLTGDFVAWGGDLGAGAIALALGTDGAWTGSRMFPAGTYLYKLIINGASPWIADPSNPDMVDDGFGGKNSRYVCAP